MSEHNIPEDPRRAGDYPAAFKKLELNKDNKPLCPSCHVEMFQRKQQQGFNTWECSNGECPLIEGEYDSQKNRLWDIHYCAEPITFYALERKET